MLRVCAVHGVALLNRFGCLPVFSDQRLGIEVCHRQRVSKLTAGSGYRRGRINGSGHGQAITREARFTRPASWSANACSMFSSE